MKILTKNALAKGKMSDLRTDFSDFLAPNLKTPLGLTADRGVLGGGLNRDRSDCQTVISIDLAK